jgi:hypothetical protein
MLETQGTAMIASGTLGISLWHYEVLGGSSGGWEPPMGMADSLPEIL